MVSDEVTGSLPEVFDMSSKNSTRRDVLKAGAAMAFTTALSAPVGAFAQGSDTIKVGLIGCGGRGSGAVENVLSSARNVTIHAVGDALEFQATGAGQRLANKAKDDAAKLGEMNNKIELGDRVFSGIDAFQKVLDSGINYVILATPPAFRPVHIKAAVEKGVNIFTEKPVGVDGPGIRSVMESFQKAKAKNLGVAAGTQRRHQTGYLETIKRIHDGEIGDLITGQVYWNQGLLWSRPRKEGMTDLEYQMWNWYNYTWICGDNVVEQHVHNLDVLNWCFREHPAAVVAMGFRSRNNPAFGNVYDFYSADIEYSGNRHCISQARQISNCWSSVSEHIQGSKGKCQVNNFTINGKQILNRQQARASTDPYVQEHTDLIESIRAGKPINELQNVAESTLTAIMVRMSAHTGARVTWDQAINSKEQLMDVANLTADMKVPEWKVPIPGTTKFI